MPPFSQPHAHIFLPPLHHLLPARTVSLHFLISPHPHTPSRSCVYFIFAESCVMTKTSHPGCVCSVPVSCPYEARGPSRAHSNAGRCFPGREEGLRAERRGWALPTPCPACWWGNFLRAKKPPQTHTYILRKKIKGFFFFFSPGCWRNLQQLNRISEWNWELGEPSWYWGIVVNTVPPHCPPSKTSHRHGNRLGFTGIRVFTKTYKRSSNCHKYFLQATFRHIIIFTVIRLFIEYVVQSVISRD